jgi:hypothetical protein
MIRPVVQMLGFGLKRLHMCVFALNLDATVITFLYLLIFLQKFSLTDEYTAQTTVLILKKHITVLMMTIVKGDLIILANIRSQDHRFRTISCEISG